MTTKNIVISLILVAIIAGAGYFFYMRNDSDYTDPEKIGTPTSNQKINVDQVCNESLVYMTFTDSVSADLFVKECKEGKHPEVIEQYKARMNLGAGAQI